MDYVLYSCSFGIMQFVCDSSPMTAMCLLVTDSQHVKCSILSLAHITVLHTYMWSIVKDGVAIVCLLVGWSVGLSVSTMNPTKTTEVINMSICFWTWVCPRKHVLDRSVNWCNLANIIELCGDAAFLKITLTTTPQPFYSPFYGTTRMSRCQKRTSGLYGARED